MTDKIVAALKSLDVNNDQHWTTDGAPRIDTLKILVANPGLSREDVNAALPGFSRATAATFATSGESGVAPGPTPDPVQPPVVTPVQGQQGTETPAPTPAEELPNLGGDPLAEQPSDDEAERPVRARKFYLPDVNEMNLEEVREYMSELNEARAEITQAIPQAQNRIAFLEGEAEKERGDAGENPIAAYLASQRRLGEERGRLRRTVEESGVDLKELNRSLQASPIDVALANRKRTPPTRK